MDGQLDGWMMDTTYVLRKDRSDKIDVLRVQFIFYKNFRKGNIKNCADNNLIIYNGQDRYTDGYFKDYCIIIEVFNKRTLTANLS